MLEQAAFGAMPLLDSMHGQPALLSAGCWLETPLTSQTSLTVSPALGSLAVVAVALTALAVALALVLLGVVAGQAGGGVGGWLGWAVQCSWAGDQGWVSPVGQQCRARVLT